MAIKLKYNEKLIVELIKSSKKKYSYITKSTALVIWIMCDNIIQRGVIHFLKKNNNLLTKSILTGKDVESDIFENVFIDLLYKFDSDKGSTFRYYLNKSINYRVLRILYDNNKAKNKIMAKIDDKGTAVGNEIISINDEIDLSNESYSEHDFLEFELKNAGFSSLDIKITKDIIAGYKFDSDSDNICLRHGIKKTYLTILKKRLKLIYGND